jgi:hypothetical protein
MSLKSGKHTAIVTAPANGWFCESSKGTAGLRIPLEIISGPCQGELCEYVGWLSHAALPGTVKTLVEAFGWDRNLDALGKLLDSGPFVGKECEITVEDEEYNGKMYPKIKWLNRVGGGARMLAKDGIAALVAKLSAEVLAVQLDDDDSKAAPKAKIKDPDLDLAPDQIPF